MVCVCKSARGYGDLGHQWGGSSVGMVPCKADCVSGVNGLPVRGYERAPREIA